MASQAPPQKGLTDRAGDKWMNGHIVVKTFGGRKHYKPWNFVLGVEELDTAEGKLPPFHRNLRDDMAGKHLESKIKAIGKRKSKEIGLVKELLDSTVEVDENKGRKKGLEQEAVQESKAPRRRGRRRSGSRRGSRRSGIA